MSHVLQVTGDTFDAEVCGASHSVLVDFYSPSCRPCVEVSPILDQIAREKAGALKVVKVDVFDEAELAARFGVSAVPTFVHLRNCREIARVSGSMPKEKLLRALELAI